ncbi:hypothetical protein [Legionella sp. 16cNR16C]|uniref:hypothetical protein n=1 Tax=Legionella sp. 16cNR16C TaxID=2905656 RepID=UPI001E46FA29|nr:hypothetical protein [Legionella sp. 16cNR16C]MCE3044123.1 hypothetical protein [Legionella sp. 16cNR16C]
MAMSSEQIHNQNCYLYLRGIAENGKLPRAIYAILPQALQDPLTNILQAAYNPNFAYADLYRDFFIFIDGNSKAIELIKRNLQKRLDILTARQNLRPNSGGFFDAKQSIQTGSLSDSQSEINVLKKEISELNDFIHKIYANDNHILDVTFETIKHIPANHKPGDKKKITSAIRNQLANEHPRVNTAPSPSDVDSFKSRAQDTFGREYKPQHKTSLATKRDYKYKNGLTLPVELRFGTQVQREKGLTQISPSFKLWLNNQLRRPLDSLFQSPDPAQRITHIYFNNLGRDRIDPEGRLECRMTQTLEGLEKEHDNIAVITLPADKGIFSFGDYHATKANLNYENEFERLFNIAIGNSNEAIKDFYISPEIKELLYGTNEQEIVKRLLLGSFNTMGATPDKPLSKAQRQAIWFDFNKFALPDRVISELKPLTFNFSCKDAIDRAGVSSAYYNLMKSIELGSPMSREEFERALHAAPAMVKGRGMNHHEELLWNAIDFYINSGYQQVKQDIPWLVQWRDDNCPHRRANELLLIRIPQARIDLQELKRSTKELSEQAGKLIDLVEEQARKNTSGKRLLLQAVSDTIDLLENPSPEKKQRYELLANQLEVKDPRWRAAAGIMKIIAGIFHYVFTFGSSKMFNSGVATFRTSQNANERKQIQLSMKELVRQNMEDTEQHDESSIPIELSI